MSIRTAILFDGSGRATPFLLAQWRNKATGQPIQPAAVLVENGLATETFRRLWQAALPVQQALPRDAIADAAGRGTDRFWRAFT